jgi:hypothetical protein
MEKHRPHALATLVLVLSWVLLASGCFGPAPAPTTTSTGGASDTTTTSAVATTSSTAATTSTGTGDTSTTTTTAQSTTSTSPDTATTASNPSTTTVTITFSAELSGAEIVPPVDTVATGSATFTFESTLTRAYFVLKVSGITDVTASRLKQGKPGTNGPGVLILYPGPTISGLHTGVLAQGWFNSTALIGPLYGKTIADLKALLESGEAYVNVGTNANPDGEIRGQVK